MGGCDKTTPALLMGAISANVPAIYLPAGPMLRGNWDGKILGSGTDVWKFWADRCAGVVSDEEWKGIEIGIARSPGFCMTMGTASTMTAFERSARHDAARRILDSRSRFQSRPPGDGYGPPRR